MNPIGPRSTGKAGVKRQSSRFSGPNGVQQKGSRTLKRCSSTTLVPDSSRYPISAALLKQRTMPIEISPSLEVDITKVKQALDLVGVLGHPQAVESFQRLRQRFSEMARKLAEKDAQISSLERKNGAHGAQLHEYGNILTPVISYLELVKLFLTANSVLPSDIAKASEFLEQVMLKLYYLSNLQRVSSLFRASNPAENISPKPLSLKETVLGQIKFWQTDAENRGISLNTSGDLNFQVMAEPELLEFILVNLIGNALKYSKEKYPDAKVEIRAQREGPFIRVAIEDNGIGIPQNNIQWRPDQNVAREDWRGIFDEDVRADNVIGNQTYMGSGKGLYNVRRVVELLGGTLGVKSEEAKGSTFFFTLPVANENGKKPKK
jgi:signal transduction histidine kinase